MKKPTREEGNSPVQAEALPLPVSLLQVLRMVHFLRKCTMRKTCKKSFRSPKATMLQGSSCSVEREYCPHCLRSPGILSGIVDQAFSIWYHHIYLIIFGACFHVPPVRKGGEEMSKSARRATSI